MVPEVKLPMLPVRALRVDTFRNADPIVPTPPIDPAFTLPIWEAPMEPVMEPAASDVI